MHIRLAFCLAIVLFTSNAQAKSIFPSDIQKIFDKPIYQNATWGLRVINRNTNEVLIDLNSSQKLFIGSVRKIFSVGELLDAVGPDHVSVTTVHLDGKVENGELKGNLVLIASGDLTMGGRTLPNGAIDITNYDHNEADSLGNAELTSPNPLAGYQSLAIQIKRAGINKISGDVIIDERLFDPYNFRDEFNLSPIFVNDDVIDVMIKPGLVDTKASVDWRPRSSALTIINNLMTSKINSKYTLALTPEHPSCLGKPNCSSEISGDLPINFIPPLTKEYPLIQTVRITQPGTYARIIFIEALRAAGVNVDAIELIKNNPTARLKAKHFYNKDNQVAALNSLPYKDHAKLILKVSYNIGADTSLILFGLTQRARNMEQSLRIERMLLQEKYGISTDNFVFIDGSGGGDTVATNGTITRWLQIMTKSHAFKPFFDALPILAVDGSLSFVKDFQSDPSLAGAKGRVYAKTGTYLKGEGDKNILKGQALAGYITTKSANNLIFQLVVNNVAVDSLDEVLKVFQDQGTIAAILWRDF